MSTPIHLQAGATELATDVGLSAPGAWAACPGQVRKNCQLHQFCISRAPRCLQVLGERATMTQAAISVMMTGHAGDTLVLIYPPPGELSTASPPGTHGPAFWNYFNSVR